MASVFISYSHKDEKYKKQLDTHLASLKNQGLIDTWHDRRIKAGDEFDSAISSELNRAEVVLFLVSPDFLSSSYIRDVELAQALQRQQAGEARVVPVILRHCDWQTTALGKLLAAPKDGVPIKSWRDRDEAFLDVIKMIRAALTITEDVSTKQRIVTNGPGNLMPAKSPRNAKLAFKIETPKWGEFIYRFNGLQKLTIGRAPDNDIVISSDLTVSRHHCLVRVLPDRVEFKDRGSTNPPIINGATSRNGTLKLYETLELGETKLILIPGD